MKSDQLHQFITGKYNKTGSNGVRITGYGDSDTSRKNIEVLDTSGNLKISGSITLDMNGTAITLTAAQLEKLLALIS